MKHITQLLTCGFVSILICLSFTLQTPLVYAEEIEFDSSTTSLKESCKIDTVTLPVTHFCTIPAWNPQQGTLRSVTTKIFSNIEIQTSINPQSPDESSNIMSNTVISLDALYVTDLLESSIITGVLPTGINIDYSPGDTTTLESYNTSIENDITYRDQDILQLFTGSRNTPLEIKIDGQSLTDTPEVQNTILASNTQFEIEYTYSAPDVTIDAFGISTENGISTIDLAVFSDTPLSRPLELYVSLPQNWKYKSHTNPNWIPKISFTPEQSVFALEQSIPLQSNNEIISLAFENSSPFTLEPVEFIVVSNEGDRFADNNRIEITSSSITPLSTYRSGGHTSSTLLIIIVMCILCAGIYVSLFSTSQIQPILSSSYTRAYLAGYTAQHSIPLLEYTLLTKLKHYIQQACLFYLLRLQ